jgi:hypothetical protein
MLAAGILALLEALGRIPLRGGRLARRRAWRMALPALPLALGCAGAFLPGVLPDQAGWGAQLIAGLWAGLVAVQGRKIALRWFVDKAKEPTP